MTTSKAPAILIADWGYGIPDRYEVQYNPKEFTIEKALQHGELAIPGLDAPLQQFVRGQAEKLTVELFFDTTESGMGAGAHSVTEHTDRIYKLAKVESKSHAPPVVTFAWGAKFPGARVEKVQDKAGGNQNREVFVGVVESVRQQFTLFSSEGIPLRATVTLVLKEFRSLDQQLKQLRLNSPDRTHAHPLQAGETLEHLAHKYYDNPARWRAIADGAGIVDPRRLEAGRVLNVPAIK
jgi:hypothetical protein